MSKINYSTERNKAIIEPTVVDAFKLNTGLVTQLCAKAYKFNSWEKIFFNSLKHNSYKIVSGKQWNIVKQLLSKY